MDFFISNSFYIAVPMLIISRVFFAFAVYNDAKFCYKTNAFMWGILCGFFWHYPLIIYLCIRKKKKKEKHSFYSDSKFSDKIDSTSTSEQTNSNDKNLLEMDRYLKRRKLFIILTIIFFALYLFFLWVCLYIELPREFRETSWLGNVM